MLLPSLLSIAPAQATGCLLSIAPFIAELISCAVSTRPKIAMSRRCWPTAACRAASCTRAMWNSLFVPFFAETGCLLLLYADAERTLPHLKHMAEQVLATLGLNADVHSLIAPLKGVERAVAKALAKYDGDYMRLTDLVRMTFECSTLWMRACGTWMVHVRGWRHAMAACR